MKLTREQRLVDALRAATQALRSYQHGNTAPELARTVADHCDLTVTDAIADTKDGDGRRYYRSVDALMSSDYDKRCAVGDEFIIEQVGGVEGDCICISLAGTDAGTRIAGPKPWGGGHVKKTWKTTRSSVLDALGVEEFKPL